MHLCCSRNNPSTGLAFGSGPKKLHWRQSSGHGSFRTLFGFFNLALDVRSLAAATTGKAPDTDGWADALRLDPDVTVGAYSKHRVNEREDREKEGCF
jgi:hypothetical protein